MFDLVILLFYFIFFYSIYSVYLILFFSLFNFSFFPSDRKNLFQADPWLGKIVSKFISFDLFIIIFFFLLFLLLLPFAILS